jgi:DNA-binding response OmpR family regulator
MAWPSCNRIGRCLATTRLLVMSAGQDAAHYARHVEADVHLTKPFDLFELLPKVRDLVDSST